jgi:3D (Asp-Asp-Asp) domain-containing protein
MDPADRSYYAKHGYAGAALNIAADYRVFPKGTKIRVPGYMESSYPDRFWTVDSPGGSIIRSSTAEGVPHIDVKFRTLYSAKRWGCQWLPLEVQDP